MSRLYYKEMTRIEQIAEIAKEYCEKFRPQASKENIEWFFIKGAEWADANSIDESQLITDLIHQRSVAFDYGREQSEMLKVAEDALNKIGCNRGSLAGTVNALNYDTASQALVKIKEMRVRNEI